MIAAVDASAFTRFPKTAETLKARVRTSFAVLQAERDRLKSA